MKKGSVIGIVILSMLLVIGFANTTANIILNNSTSIIFNENFFNIYITNQTGDGTITLSEDRREINYTSKSLSAVGDTSILEYEVVNDSAQYDANVLLETTLDSNSNKYRVTYETIDDSNPYLLSSKRKVKAKITIELIEQVNNPLEANINIKLILTALGRTEEGKEVYTVIYDGNGATSGTMPNQEVELDKPTSLLSNQYSKTNYVFAGWSTRSNGDVEYTNNQSVSYMANPGGIVTLYAVWQKVVTDFDYTGNIQSFKALASGKYKLEVWGAQGGTVSYNNVTITGSYGGYSTGNVNLNSGDNLYIGVGGTGSTSSGGVGVYKAGGFNGGGGNTQSQWGYAATGGGATHIAINDSRTNLSLYSDATDSVLIVAGGGGAGGVETGGSRYTYGGNGGGYIGNTGKSMNCNGSGCPTAGGIGGNQTTGAAFGKGSDGSSWAGAAGGGWYGGYVDGGGGGGSGYIGNARLTNKIMYCFSCQSSGQANTKTSSNTCVDGSAKEKCSKLGNGHARITYIG
jgi:uncharacterized repeat protein (TIGR02543 family)